jgi:hypothetical protein
MAGLKDKSGPPGNMNAFKHGLAAIQKRREEGVPTPACHPFLRNPAMPGERPFVQMSLAPAAVRISALSVLSFGGWDHYSVQIDISTSF